MKTIAALGRTLSRIYHLARLCAGGPGAAFGLFLCALVLTASLGGVYIGVQFIAWNKAFFDALQKIDANEAVRQIGVFFLLISASAGLYLIGRYIRQVVFIRWRSRLNSIVLDRWMEKQAYWRLQPGILDDAIENPDQRIAEDCRIFVDKLLLETLELITKMVAIFSYLWILWQLSSFPLSFSLFGVDVYIPRYMVWAAFIYVALSTWLTHWLGAPLKDLLFRQQQREADYRFALARMRDAADEIALANGERAERRILNDRYSAVVTNWHRVIRREFIQGLFVRPYFQTVLRIPLFLALPAYLAGQVTFGGLMQVRSAFTQVVTTLSWFIFSYRDLAEWVATTERLTGMLETIERATDKETGIHVSSHNSSSLVINDLALETPAGHRLELTDQISINKGEFVWINAPSGTGKSTLFKAIAGIWPHGSGRILHPQNWRPAFVPQDVYLSLGNLDDNSIYPLDSNIISNEFVRSNLNRVGLAHLHDVDSTEIETIGEESAPDTKGLSGGEKQRLAFSRLLAQKPDWIFLDETINALDSDAAQALLTLLTQELEGATLVVVSHVAPSLPGAAFRQIPVERSKRTEN